MHSQAIKPRIDAILQEGGQRIRSIMASAINSALSSTSSASPTYACCTGKLMCQYNHQWRLSSYKSYLVCHGFKLDLQPPASYDCHEHLRTPSMESTHKALPALNTVVVPPQQLQQVHSGLHQHCPSPSPSPLGGSLSRLFQVALPPINRRSISTAAWPLTILWPST